MGLRYPQLGRVFAEVSARNGPSLMQFRYTIPLFLLLSSFHSKTAAQPEVYVHEGEVGFLVGASHYFGDLNNRSSINRPKSVLGIFVRKQISNYVAVRFSANYAQVGYADQYSKVEFNRRRNLSFNSDILELALQGDFNFYRFQPFSHADFFTPYVTLGAGVFNFNPYAYLRGTKYFLRPLGTEGQGSTVYPNRKFYRTMSVCFPVGMGIKYNLARNLNVTLEAVYRFTTTDYLDDVSSTYAGSVAFPLDPTGRPSIAFQLQDRSNDTGVPIGGFGRQRGFSAQRDQYLFLQAGLSFSISSYRCPD